MKIGFKLSLSICQVSVRMRVAVVTGSNKGIGLGVVRALCRQYQGEVYLTSRDEARGREAVASLNREGLHPRYHVLDIEDEESVLKLRDHIAEASSFMSHEYPKTASLK